MSVKQEWGVRIKVLIITADCFLGQRVGDMERRERRCGRRVYRNALGDSERHGCYVGHCGSRL